LVRAQRYIDVLNNWLHSKGTKQIQPDICHINLTEFVKLSINSEEVKKRVTDKCETIIKNMNDRLMVNSDLKRLKNLVYDTNAKSGLSDILTQINLLTEEREFYKSIKKGLAHVNYVMNDIDNLITTYQKKEQKDSVEQPICVKLFSDKYLDDIIVEYNKKILKLDINRDNLNATTKIDFEFSDASKKILGL